MGGSKSRVLKIFSSVGVILGAIGLSIVIVLFVITNASHTMYSVVLDAGSSSTKMNLFTWRDEAFRTNAEVSSIAHEKVDGGISNYVDNPFEAYNAMSGKLGNLTSKIPPEEKHQTPVYLAATAGMRLKLLENPLGSLKLFDVLRRGLLKSGLEVETPNERIRMLSGAEEGLFGWVSVNNILGRISAKNQAPPLDTVGSLDLGGASTQIAFVPENGPPTEETSVDFYPLKLFGTEYNVYSHSFLCFGKDQFEARIKAAVIGTQTVAQINHPCLLKGYTLQNQNADTIYASPCVTGSYAEKVFPKKLTKPAGLTTFSFIGTGNASECKRIIEEQFNTQGCTTSTCSFNGVYQPPVRGEFRAYSGYSYVIKYLFKDITTGLTPSTVETKVQELCGTPWSTIKDQPGSKYTAKFCFDGTYVMVLLKNLGFDTDDKFRKITFGANIDGKPVSWALGYMLEQSGHLPSEIPQIYMPLALFASLAAIFALITILSIIGLVLICLRGEKGN